MVVMNKVGRRSYVQKHQYHTIGLDKVPNQRGEWPDEVDEALRSLCRTTLSYEQIADRLNAKFPEMLPRKTRNAVLGRASRKGYRTGKPASTPVYKKRGRPVGRPRTSVLRVKNEAKKQLALVVFKGKATLRSEDDRASAAIAPSRRLSSNDPLVIERKKGHIPCIIEEHPLTSTPIFDTERDTCKWPTSEDILCMEVCGAEATIGAYCERHAHVAYRVMPTKRRNRAYHRDETEYTRRLDHEAHQTAGSFLAPDKPADEDVILALPHFIGRFDE